MLCMVAEVVRVLVTNFAIGMMLGMTSAPVIEPGPSPPPPKSPRSRPQAAGPLNPDGKEKNSARSPLRSLNDRDIGRRHPRLAGQHLDHCGGMGSGVSVKSPPMQGSGDWGNLIRAGILRYNGPATCG